jgi:hypothetical protein
MAGRIEMMRSVLFLLGLCGILAGCSLGANEGASSTPARVDHGGYTGQAAHYYDFGYKTCRRLTYSYIAEGKDPNSMSYLTLAPDQFKQAAEDGCNSGKASAVKIKNCKVVSTGSTSELDCSYPSTTEP